MEKESIYEISKQVKEKLLKELEEIAAQYEKLHPDEIGHYIARPYLGSNIIVKTPESMSINTDEAQQTDMVNHPPHYQSKGLEVINVIEAFTEGLSGIEATDTGNIIKYACRWKRKNGIEDLKKIVWYANHLINHLENKEK